jgi:Ca2+-binding EF-hand superfamily protein
MSEEKYRTASDGELDRMISEVGLMEQPGQLLPGSPQLDQQRAASNSVAPPKRVVGPAASAAHQEAWLWEDTPENEAKLRHLFAMIDRVEPEDHLALAAATDAGGASAAPAATSSAHGGDGGISSSELMHMLVNLGEDIPPDQADEMIDLIDTDGSHEVEFSEFYAVLTGRISLDGSASAPHKARAGNTKSLRAIREHFNAVDDDGGGYLDKHEVGELGEKMGNLKRRHLVDAMAAMDPADTGQVTFDMFKNW